MARDGGGAPRRRRRDRRHRTGSQPGIGRAGRAPVPGGPRLRASAHEAVDWAHTAIYIAFPGYRAILLPGTPDAERLAAVIAGRGGATVAMEAAVPLPAGIPGRLVTPAVADILAVELWTRVTGQLKVP